MPYGFSAIGGSAGKQPSLLERLLGGLSGGGPLGIGVSLLGGLIQTGSERRRLEELRKASENALKPLEAEAAGARFGLSQTEGNLAQGATESTLGSLASRGVLQSSFAPGEVAQAVAPVELHRQERLMGLERDIAAGKKAIAGETSLPGFGAAAGGALGDIGGFLALRGGVEEGRKRGKKSRTDRLLDLLDQSEETE
jgi:hypothetical protein